MYLSGKSKAEADGQREQYVELEKALDVKKIAEAQYPNNAEGFWFFMNSVLSEAHKGDVTQLGELVRETEIPNYREWFSSTYSPDKAESWIEPYGKNLEARKKALQEQFMNIAIAGGEIHVRKVNGAPKPGSEIEWGMLHALKKPLDIYYASWSAPSLRDAEEEPIGYFFFVDGGFRWDSVVEFAKVRPVAETANVEPRNEVCSGGDRPVSGPVYKTGSTVTAPKALRAPDPEYSEEARQKKFSGSVEFSLVADVDGCAKNIRMVKPIGYGLDQKAIEALRMWRFQPGSKDGNPVPVELHVSMHFRLY